jgi:hypothetical protein
MHDKTQLELAVAAHHEFCVPANLLRRFGAILATDQGFFAPAGQCPGPIKRNSAVSFNEICGLFHAGTAGGQIMYKGHQGADDEVT